MLTLPSDFLQKSPEEIAEIVKKVGTPKTVLIVPDNIRRTGIIYKGLDPTKESFERQVFEALNKPYIRLLENIFKHGIRTIFVPSLIHGNLNRYTRYVKEHLRLATYWIFRSEEWLSFYNRLGIRVKVYGDLEYFGRVARSLGFDDALEWCKQVEDDTARNNNHLLFWGVACSGSIETQRLVKLGIDFYRRYGREPTHKELILLYFREDVEPIDIFIRPGEIRDSDCQPPLIGGNAEMYFPVVPLTELPEDFFKQILYDYLYCRLRTFGRKQYSEITREELEVVKRHYEDNRDIIIGLGERYGNFWIPKLTRRRVTA